MLCRISAPLCLSRCRVWWWPEPHCLCQLPAAWARPVFLPRRRQPSLIQAGLWPAAGSLASFSGAVSDGVCSLRGVVGRPSKWASAHSLATVFLPCVCTAFPPAARVGLRCSPSLHASPFSLCFRAAFPPCTRGSPEATFGGSAASGWCGGPSRVLSAPLPSPAPRSLLPCPSASSPPSALWPTLQGTSRGSFLKQFPLPSLQGRE